MCKIMVVDDERDMVDILADVLRRWGYEVETAVSGKEALEKIRVGDYGLALVDIRMAGMNGVEFFRRARAISPGLEALIVSAARGPEASRTAWEMGALGCIEKPFRLEQLEAWLQANGFLPDPAARTA